jgi:hypothetical protein
MLMASLTVHNLRIVCRSSQAGTQKTFWWQQQQPVAVDDVKTGQVAEVVSQGDARATSTSPDTTQHPQEAPRRDADQGKTLQHASALQAAGLLSDIAGARPAVLSALQRMERDGSGRLSAACLARIGVALAGVEGSTTTGGNDATISSDSLPGGLEEDLQAALDRHVRVISLVNCVPPSPHPCTRDVCPCLCS